MRVHAEVAPVALVLREDIREPAGAGAARDGGGAPVRVTPAVAFAGLLIVIMRSDEVRGILTDLVRRALTVQ